MSTAEHETGTVIETGTEREAGSGIEPRTRVDRKVNQIEFRRRVVRLQESAKRAGIWSAPVFFVFLALLLFIVNRRPDSGLLWHTFDSLGSALVGAVTCGAVIWGASILRVAWYDECLQKLSRDGRLVAAKRRGKPQIWGGAFMTSTVGGIVGALWEPLAPLLGKRLPIFEVAYRFEIDGREVVSSELFYGDEAIVLEDDGETAWVYVDPEAPQTRHWLLRESGELQDCPFRVASDREA